MRSIGRWFADLPGGRRTKFAVVGVWLVVVVAIFPLSTKFEDAQQNDPADYLPAKAESVKAIEELEEFPSGDIADAITVFNRDGGLTGSDRAAIEETRAAIDSERREGVGETSPPIFSEDESSALLITPITFEDGTNEAAVGRLSHLPAHLRIAALRRWALHPAGCPSWPRRPQRYEEGYALADRLNAI